MKFQEFYNLVFSKKTPTEKDLFSETISNYRKIFKTDDLFFESPVFVGNYGGFFNTQAINQQRAKEVIRNDKKIGEYIYAGESMDIYKNSDNGRVEISLVWRGSLLASYCYYKELSDGGAEIDSAWSHQEIEGIYRDFFWNWLLPQYKYIQSSATNTRQSSTFWIRVCERANQTRNKFVLINTNEPEWYEEIKDYNQLKMEFKDIWNNDAANIRLRVYSK